MRYSNEVNICFSVSDIEKFCSDDDYLLENAERLCAEVDELAKGASEYIANMLEYIKSCLDVNNTDSQNAKSFSQWLQNAVWKTEQELKEREANVNTADRNHKSAVANYEYVRATSKPGDKTSESALESANRQVRSAKEALNVAIAERDDCKRRLECLKKAENDLYWIKNNIHNDWLMLTEKEEEFNRLASDIRSVYEKFSKQSQIGIEKIGDAIACANLASKYAKAARYHIGKMIGAEQADDSTTKISSIHAIYRAGDEMDSLVRRVKSRTKFIKETSNEYNELVIDNIIAASADLIDEINETVSHESRVLESKAENTKDLASQLQHYYDLVQ